MAHLAAEEYLRKFYDFRVDFVLDHNTKSQLKDSSAYRSVKLAFSEPGT